MMKFIDREKEIEFLERKYKSKEAELLILYGRRRIGKTEMILNFCENKDSAYFIGRLESREDTIKRFNNLILEKFNDEKLLNSPLQNWDATFDYITEKVEKRFIFALIPCIKKYLWIYFTVQRNGPENLIPPARLISLSGWRESGVFIPTS